MRGRHFFENGFKEQAEIRPALLQRALGDAGTPDRIEHGELELILGRIQIDEQVVDLIEHLGRRASERSILLTHTMILRPASSAFLSTKRVCGNGPSAASTSSRAPSTIISARSTSPPKSACPGVSRMLILTPSQ